MPILKHLLKVAQAFLPVPALNHFKVAQAFLPVPALNNFREILNCENFGAGRKACATLKRWKIGTGTNACATLPLLIAAVLALAACASTRDAAKNTTAAPTAPTAPAAPAATTATITRVWPDYRAADTFDRISEYFTGAENTGGQIVMRTHPETRAGYYFFTRLKVETPPAAASAASPATAAASTTTAAASTATSAASATTAAASAPAAITDAQVEISVILPDSPDVKTYRLRVPVALRAGTVLLNPGLTGADWPWPDAKTHPVAWRLRLLTAAGAELASRQSYLWSK